MFISDDEARRRLENPRNLLKRVDRGSDLVSEKVENPPLPSPFPAPLPPDPPHPPDDQTTSSIDPTVLLRLARDVEEGPGRKSGIRNRTIEENASIALTGKLLGQKSTEEMFGVSQPVTSALTHGKTSSTSPGRAKVKEELLDAIYGQSEIVVNKAFRKLLKSLDLLSDEKLEGVTKATDLTHIAKNLSGIVKDATPKEVEQREQSVHFHIYSPEQNTEDHYETVEVNRDGTVSISV